MHMRKLVVSTSSLDASSIFGPFCFQLVAASPDNCAFCAYLGFGCGHIMMNTFLELNLSSGMSLVVSSMQVLDSFFIPACCISFRFISTSLSSFFLGFRLLHTVTHTLDSSSPIIARFNSLSAILPGSFLVPVFILSCPGCYPFPCLMSMIGGILCSET